MRSILDSSGRMKAALCSEFHGNTQENRITTKKLTHPFLRFGSALTSRLFKDSCCAFLVLRSAARRNQNLIEVLKAVQRFSITSRILLCDHHLDYHGIDTLYFFKRKLRSCEGSVNFD